jgi:hypothetical protein
MGKCRIANLPSGRKKYDMYASELNTPISVDEALHRRAKSVTVFVAKKVHEAELSSVNRLNISRALACL